MSDVPGGPGWWRASDGRWYPPQTAPGAPGGYGAAWGQPSLGDAPGATASLVCGILSMFLCGLFTGIPAIVLGVKARREVRESGGRYQGDGTALAGIITGAIGSVLATLGIVAVVGLALLGSTVDGVNTDPVDGVCNEDRWWQDPDCGAGSGSGPAGGGINSDPSDGVCDEDRFLQDPDCGSGSGSGSGGINSDPPDGSCDADRWMQDPDCG